jgi:BspA type Leucine rich repeat region (6 copies)
MRTDRFYACKSRIWRESHAFISPTLVKTPENRIGMANAHLTANERTFALQWKLQNEKFAMTKFALLLLTTLLPGGAIAQFSYTVSNNTVTITAYTGPGGAVVIPSTIIGLPVVSIGASAFANHPGLTSIMIPQSVSSIGLTPFSGSSGLTAITVDAGNLSYSSVDGVLFNKNQTVLVVFPSGRGGSYVLPNSVTNIGEFAFYSCLGLTNITIDAGVQFISRWGFSGIGNTNLTALYFEGNAPIPLPAAFQAFKALVYYLPGTTGWSATYAGYPTALWKPLILTFEPNFGVQTNNFGFTVSWAPNTHVVVEACTNLANPVWSLVATLTLAGRSAYFSDAQWTNYSDRFYRLRSP